MGSTKRIALTRPQVAALLSRTEAEVRAMDGSRLHPHKGSDGGWLYPPEQVLGLLRQELRVEGPVAAGAQGPVSTNGETASAAFSMYEKGEGPARVVVECKVNPMLASDLKRTFDDMTGAITISARARIELQRHIGKIIGDGDDLVKILKQIWRPRLQATTTSSASNVSDADDFGMMVDPATGKLRPISKSESELGASSLIEKPSVPSDSKLPSDDQTG